MTMNRLRVVPIATLKSDIVNEVAMPDYRGNIIKPGERVLLRKEHPWAGRIGTYKGVEFIPVLQKWGCLVRFEDDGLEQGCFVLKSDYWEKVTP